MSRAALLAGALALAAAPALACEHYRPRPVSLLPGASYLNPAGEVRIVGYNDMAEMIAGLDRAFEAAHPGIRLRPDLQGTRTAPPALAAGTSALAPMGAWFSPAELAAYRQAVGAEPLAFRVAHASLDPKALSGPLGVFVHRDNPLPAAALARLAPLFTDGRPHSWGELGLKGAWADQPIHPVGLAPQTALALEFRARVFPKTPYFASYTGLAQSRDVVRQVAADPLALGFAAANRGGPEVKALALAARPGVRPVAPTVEAVRAGRYPLDRHLLIYVRPRADGRLDPLARDYLALALSCEGQAIIGAGSLGYMPLNAGELKKERARLR